MFPGVDLRAPGLLRRAEGRDGVLAEQKELGQVGGQHCLDEHLGSLQRVAGLSAVDRVVFLASRPAVSA